MSKHSSLESFLELLLHIIFLGYNFFFTIYRYVSTHKLVLPIVEIEVISLLLNEENLVYCEVCPFLQTVLKADSNYLFLSSERMMLIYLTTMRSISPSKTSRYYHILAHF